MLDMEQPVSAISQDIKVEDDIEIPTGTTGSPPDQLQQ